MTPRERTDQQCQRLAQEHAWRQTHPPVPWEHHPNRRVFHLRFHPADPMNEVTPDAPQPARAALHSHLETDRETVR